MKKIVYAIIVSTLIFSSCQKDEEIGGTAVQELSGEWWVQEDGQGSYYRISTYNTAANSSAEMWLEDGFWQTKFKVPVNVPNLSFGGAGITNSDPDYDIKITVTDGKIIKKASKGPVSKALTDSIYFKVNYSDDPTSTYTLSGYRRTKFTEDDH